MDNSETRPTEDEYLRELKEIRIPHIISALEQASQALPKDHPIQSWIADIISTCRSENNFKEWRPSSVVRIVDALSEQIKNDKSSVDNIKACQDAFRQLLQASEVIAVSPKQGSELDDDHYVKSDRLVGEGRHLVVQSVHNHGYYVPLTGTWLKCPKVILALQEHPSLSDSNRTMTDHLGKKYKIGERGELLSKEDGGK